jgi:hypothetical protein
MKAGLKAGPDEEQVPVQIRTCFVKTADDSYRAALQLTEVDRQRYATKAGALGDGRRRCAGGVPHRDRLSRFLKFPPRLFALVNYRAMLR